MRKCVFCGTVSYAPHDDDCPIIRGPKKLSEEYNLSKKVDVLISIAGLAACVALFDLVFIIAHVLWGK